MSATRNIVDLLLILLERQQISGPELKERFDVDGRTIRNYITTLKEAGVPITATKGRFSKYVLSNQHRLLGFRFTPEDMEMLKAAEPFLKIEKGYSYEVQLNRLVQRIKEQGRVLVEPCPVPVSGQCHEDPNRNRQLGMMDCIGKALKEYRKLEISYQAGGTGVKTTRVIWPFGLHNTDDENYLLAHCELRDEVREFNLKRIVEMKLLDSYYPKKERISVKEYFQNSIGAFGGEPFEIKLRISGPFASTERERRRFRKQKIEEVWKDEIELTATVAGKPNIISWILSMGPHCLVVKPESLRREVIGLIKEMHECYFDKANHYLGMD